MIDSLSEASGYVTGATSEIQHDMRIVDDQAVLHLRLPEKLETVPPSCFTNVR